MKRVLIDADVILDFFFDRKPFADDAAKILAYCESKKVAGYVTSVTVSNVYYLLRQTASHAKVVEKLKQLIHIMEVLTTDKNTIQMALNSGFKDFEDALQSFSAENSGIVDAIITRNSKDYKNSALGVMTPDSYVNLILSQEVKKEF